MSFIFIITDNINSPRYCMHYVIIPELILHSVDVALVLPTHTNNHVTPKYKIKSKVLSSVLGISQLSLSMQL